MKNIILNQVSNCLIFKFKIMATIRKKINIHPSKLFYTYLYPLYAREFLFGNDRNEFLNLIDLDFDLTPSQWNAVIDAWEEKEEFLID